MVTHTSIFIKNLTILDAAVLDNACGPLGQSWFVDVVLSGPKNEEGVVIDFAKGKRRVKEIIDLHFDHRLFVGENHFRSENGRGQVWLNFFDKKNANENLFFALDTYENGLVVFPSSCANTHPTINEIELAIETRVLNEMRPLVNAVKIKLRQHEQRTESNYFTYTHSLRQHDGNCQRFHGHSNIVEVLKNGVFDPMLSADVAAKLDGCYLISNDYLASFSDTAFSKINAFSRNENVVGVRYQGSQGEVVAIVPKSKLIVLPTESTIENISEFIKKSFLQNDPSLQVIAYEGIQKGALSS